MTSAHRLGHPGPEGGRAGPPPPRSPHPSHPRSCGCDTCPTIPHHCLEPDPQYPQIRVQVLHIVHLLLCRLGRWTHPLLVVVVTAVFLVCLVRPPPPSPPPMRKSLVLDGSKNDFGGDRDRGSSGSSSASLFSQKLPPAGKSFPRTLKIWVVIWSDRALKSSPRQFLIRPPPPQRHCNHCKIGKTMGGFPNLPRWNRLIRRC